MKAKKVLTAAALSVLLAGCTSDIHLFHRQVYFKSFEYTGSDPVFETPLDKDAVYTLALQGSYSDASICRKGDDYYAVTATYSFFPGVAVLHSRDLVNWRQISYALATEKQCLNTSLKTEQGIFPCTIRYDKKTDMFYITGNLVGAGGHFVIQAKDPAGEWSDPQWLYGIGGVHPSLFFDDDGKTYILNQGNPYAVPLYPDYKAIWIQPFNTATLQNEGERRVILHGGDGGGDVMKNKPIWLEAPHLFKIGQYYYLTASEDGGLGKDFTANVFRSENIYGPYKRYPKNPILTQRTLPPDRENAVLGTGHTDFVDTPDGRWFAVFQGIRPYDRDGNYLQGRETYIMPVRFDDGWPYVVRPNEALPLTIKPPLGKTYENDTAAFAHYIPHGNFTYRENFASETLPLHWFYLRTPVTPNPKRGGDIKEGIVLNLEMNNIRSVRHTAFVAMRLMHNYFSAETEMHFVPSAEKEFGGLAVFGGDRHNYCFGLTSKDGKTVLTLFQAAQDTASGKKEIASTPPGESFEGRIFLRIERTSNGFAFKYKFKAGDAFQTLKDGVSAEYLSCQRNGAFYGNVIGIYASDEEE